MFKFLYDTQFCCWNFGDAIEPDELVNATILDLPEMDLDLFNISNEFDVESQVVNKVSRNVFITAICTKITLQWGFTICSSHLW